ncbi:hypothetical protein [Phormidesmis priestleyi]
MNLPFILDVALGLIFVYLILSLLASEIQELIAALLQWRAKHLRESVMNILAGGKKSPNEQKQVEELVNKIYNDPLIQNINQASTQGVAYLFRRITWQLSDWWNWFSQKILLREDGKRTFRDNQRSAPSYIPTETFATTLIESIGISDLSRLLVQQRLKKFQERLTKLVEGTLQENYEQEAVKRRADKFNSELQQIIENHKNCEANLRTCISRMMESLDRLAVYFKEYSAEYTHEVFNELQATKINHFGEKGERAFLFGLQPSISELIELTDKGSRVYREIKPLYEAILNEDSLGSEIARKVDAEVTKFAHKDSSDVFTEEDREKFTFDVIESLNLTEADRRTYEIYRNFQQIDQVINGLPKFVKDSLRVLARRAESRMQQIGFHTQEVGNEVAQLRREIEVWFDRSMDRASGVYKRNAKGFAIVLGFVLAVSTNSDTFHISSRLSNDEKLRQVIVQNAATISQNNSSKFEYDAIKEGTDKALKDIPLPIGWNPRIVKEQLNCNQAGNNWSAVYQCFDPKVSNGKRHPFWTLCSAATMFIGWVFSGIAIAMGAPFWFDMLSKVVNVRNTGKPPESSTTGQTTSSSNPSAPGS